MQLSAFIRVIFIYLFFRWVKKKNHKWSKYREKLTTKCLAPNVSSAHDKVLLSSLQLHITPKDVAKDVMYKTETLNISPRKGQRLMRIHPSLKTID